MPRHQLSLRLPASRGVATDYNQVRLRLKPDRIHEKNVTTAAESHMANNQELPEIQPGSANDPVKIYFDYMWLPGQKMLCHAVVVRHGQRAHLDFQLSLSELYAKESPERIQTLQFVWERMHQKGRQLQDTTWITSRLLDIALQQQGILDKETRDLEVRRLMLYGSKPVATNPPDQRTKSETSGGINPLLLLISQYSRRRLWQQHGIDVAELQREAEQLYHEVEHFWETIPPESVPLTEPYFSYTARQFDRRVLAHHQKVRQVGQLLGKELGQLLVRRAELTIKNLSA
jgi:hypothetical protein